MLEKRVEIIDESFDESFVSIKLPCDLIEFGLCLTESGFMVHYTMYLISLIKQIEIAFVVSKPGRLLISLNSTDIFSHQMFVVFVMGKRCTIQSTVGHSIGAKHGCNIC